MRDKRGFPFRKAHRMPGTSSPARARRRACRTCCTECTDSTPSLQPPRSSGRPLSRLQLLGAGNRKGNCKVIGLRSKRNSRSSQNATPESRERLRGQGLQRPDIDPKPCIEHGEKVAENAAWKIRQLRTYDAKDKPKPGKGKNHAKRASARRGLVGSLCARYRSQCAYTMPSRLPSYFGSAKRGTKQCGQRHG